MWVFTDEQVGPEMAARKKLVAATTPGTCPGVELLRVFVQECKKFICQMDSPFPHFGPNMGIISRAVVIYEALLI